MSDAGLPLFAYGTLKQGLCNHGLNPGRRVPGQYETLAPYRLLVLGPLTLPWLLAGGAGAMPVRGELYTLPDAEAWAALDRFERVGEPGWMHRATLQVRRVDAPGGAPVTAWVYLGDATVLASQVVHEGPLPEYTHALDLRYGDHDG